MSVLLVATTNHEKLIEIGGILAGLPCNLVSLNDISRVAPPVETGATFAENARLKAIYYANVSGVLTVAEDSGLEVAALDGAPGVHSARYGEPDAVSYPEKFVLLYQALRDRGVTSSPARFTCALVLARPGTILFEAVGQIEGHIAPEPRGTRGFGYDPIFFYPPFNCTLGEVTRERKASVSHRGEAFRKLREYLERLERRK